MVNTPVIGFVITARDSLEHVNTLARKKGCRLVSIQSGLEDALHPARRMVERDGVEAILSRRGTAFMLREHVDVPVMSLPDNTVSLIRAVKRALMVGPRVAITVFQSQDSNIDLCEEMLGIRLDTIIYTSKKTLESGVLAARNRGADVVIGGGVTQWAAEKHDVPYVHLHEHDEITEVIFENLISVIHNRRMEMEKHERFRAILNSVSDGVMAVDTEGRINELNARACAMLQLDETEALGRKFRQVLPDAELARTFRTGRQVSRITMDGQGRRLLVNGLPIRAPADNSLRGAVYSMQLATQVLQAEERVRASFKAGLSTRYRLEDFWHKDAHMAAVIQRARRYAAAAATVLVTGESGTGKEILAQGIHRASPRGSGPFVSINCSAMPEQLLESELFGYVEGAFTGSRRGGKIGMFELAQGGTVFLDEIGTIPPAFQSRLLRVLQEKEVMRVGSNVIMPLDVRVIAATNRDLAREVRRGRLREDLYFRLNVLSVDIPPLRERRGDIALIFRRLLREAAQRHQLAPLAVPAAGTRALCRLPWPGNVRQLQSFVEHLVILSPQGFDPEVFERLFGELERYVGKGGAIALAAGVPDGFAAGFPPAALGAPLGVLPDARPAGFDGAGQAAFVPAPAPVPRRVITPEMAHAALRRAGNSRTEAARLLGVSRCTLWRMLRRWEMAPPRAEKGHA